jgi:hypothetical protein
MSIHAARGESVLWPDDNVAITGIGEILLPGSEVKPARSGMIRFSL